MTQLFRSLIFVPGNNPRFLEKAKKIQADVICFDLEDSVPDDEKISARKLIKTALKSRKSYQSSIFVRTNSPSSGKIPSDLKEVIQKGIDGIVIPKVNNIGELKKIQKQVIDVGITVVATSLFITKKGIAKLNISIAKGKREFDKRNVIRERESKISLKRIKKNFNN